VAVRSSATSEDLKTASFAGQHESYLWVKGEEEVVQHILKCWASLFTDRAIAYRNQIGWPHDKVTISVGVQKMVNAKCAGVMFTIDPVIGDENKIVVEGNWGLGESIVKGEVSPDHFLVDKQSSKILEKNVALKLVCYQLEGNKVVCTPPSIEKQNQLCLNDEELVEIARLGKISEPITNRLRIWSGPSMLTSPSLRMFFLSRPDLSLVRGNQNRAIRISLSI